MDFLITIDTEADNQWSRPARFNRENTRFLPRFQHLCDRFGFKPTYLCTYEMATDPLFRDTIAPYQASGRAEIGAHLHPWSNPPLGPGEGEGALHLAFPHELPLDVFEAKMRMLTDAITRAFGRAPTSYRAGRYGFHEPHIDVLLRLGYEVDCSVTPYTSHRDAPGSVGGAGGMDFRKARPGAYRLSRDDCTRAGDSALLEVPVTILFPRWPASRSPAVQQWCVNHPGTIGMRAMVKLGFGPQWFRPTRRTRTRQLLAIYREARRLGLPCAEMMFHSSELMPGGSPTFPDAASIEELYETFSGLFAALAGEGARGLTLTEFARLCPA